MVWTAWKLARLALARRWDRGSGLFRGLGFVGRGFFLGGGERACVLEVDPRGEDGAIAALGRVDGAEDVAHGGLAGRVRRFGAGDAAEDAEDAVDRVGGVLCGERVGCDLLDAEVQGSAVAKAGNELGVDGNGKLKSHHRHAPVLTE